MVPGALVFGAEMWIAFFIATFFPLYELKTGMSAALGYLLVFFLPQVVSATAGAFAFVAAQATPRRPSGRGTAFAAVTCLLAAVGATLFQLLAGIDEWTGKAGAGWVIGLACGLVAIDVLVAALCGHLVGAVAVRLGRR